MELRGPEEEVGNGKVGSRGAVAKGAAGFPKGPQGPVCAPFVFWSNLHSMNELGASGSILLQLKSVSFQGLVTFKDVAVCFSQDQWSDLDPVQKEFYGEYVLEEDCGIVVSLCKEFQVFLECSEPRGLSPIGNCGSLRP